MIGCLFLNAYHQLTNEKKNNKDFSEFITKYDIVCLYETWTSKTSKIDLIGFNKSIHLYRRFKIKEQNEQAMASWYTLETAYKKVLSIK